MEVSDFRACFGNSKDLSPPALLRQSRTYNRQKAIHAIIVSLNFLFQNDSKELLNYLESKNISYTFSSSIMWDISNQSIYSDDKRLASFLFKSCNQPLLNSLKQDLEKKN